MFKLLFLLVVYGSCEFLVVAEDEVNLVTSASEDGNASTDTIDLSGFGDALYGQPSEATGKLVEELDKSSEINPEEVGEYLEGDILVPRDPKMRNGIVGQSSRWPNGIIPFEIKGRFSE